jgi:hypothetical protein
LNICVGGVGAHAGRYIQNRYRSDGEPFPMALLQLDTDPATSIDNVDTVRIQLTIRDVGAMRANPLAFGETVQTIIQEFDRLLTAGDILNGSRTTRGLTQLAFHYHRERIARALRLSLVRLRERFKVSTILPVIISSSGGGTGSASQILLMDLLRQPAFRHRVLGGVPSDLLLAPLSFVAEPFVYAQETSIMQGRKIMANALAFRLESEAMLQQAAANYVCHIGYANAGGTVLADPELMAKVLGYGVFEIERGWPQLKARWVDGPDDQASVANYGGQDVPAFDLDGSTLRVRRKYT